MPILCISLLVDAAEAAPVVFQSSYFCLGTYVLRFELALDAYTGSLVATTVYDDVGHTT